MSDHGARSWLRRWWSPRSAVAEASSYLDTSAPSSDESPSLPIGAVPTPGDVLSRRYQLEDMLGRGAGAVVFRARDTLLDHAVAVKVLLPEGLYTQPDAAAIDLTLRAEARASLRLTHPNIVRTFTYERDGDWEYLVMELVDGGDLWHLRVHEPSKRFGAERVLEIGVACCDALAYAHDQGFVHNDIKPGNLLQATDGTIKMCDFGLARRHDAEGRKGLLVGSPVYMAPERIEGLPGDARSDLYALGATLYCLGTGRFPYGRNAKEAMRGHLAGQLPPAPELPPEVEGLLRRALARRPTDRFRDARAMRDALVRLLAHLEEEGEDAPTEVSVTELTSEAPLPPPAFVAVPGPNRQTSTPFVSPPPPERRPRPAPEGAVRLNARVVEVRGQRLSVPAFHLDRTPVTNAAYARFLEATGAVPPAHWVGRRAPRGEEDRPVVGVTHDDAVAYLRWAGRRLPTEAEWIAAVRGEDGQRRFPWGDACDRQGCHCALEGASSTCAVTAHPKGATPEGVVDLLGNVWEWVDPDPRAPFPDPSRGLALGGSYRHACATPGEVPRVELEGAKSYLYLGFRGAADVEA